MQRKILVVDDSKFTLELIKSILEKENFNLEFASNGKEGVKKAQEFIPDLIILDIEMPVMNGFEACKNLKEDDVTKNIPVLMLTSKDTMDDLKKGFEVKADYYMTKPFDSKSLTDNVKKVFSEIIK